MKTTRRGFFGLFGGAVAAQSMGRVENAMPVAGEGSFEAFLADGAIRTPPISTASADIGNVTAGVVRFTNGSCIDFTNGRIRFKSGMFSDGARDSQIDDAEDIEKRRV